MGILSNLTIEQLIDATPTQITVAKAGVKNKIDNMTKKQFLIFLLRVADIDIENLEIQDREEGEGDSRGPLWQLRIVRDVLGNKLRSTRSDYTYYPPQPDGTQPRDTITVIEMDENDGVISTRKLKHYADGITQPEWIE